MVLTAQHIPHMQQQHKTDTQKKNSSQQTSLTIATADTPPKQKQKQKQKGREMMPDAMLGIGGIMQGMCTDLFMIPHIVMDWIIL
jgi:hypothetical protein